MRKVESTRALCDYYNEIVYKVNKLTEMCGNTPEAIKLRDDIDDMFTVKFSEPLDDVAELQEEIGCPLDVRCKVAYDSYIYDEDGIAYTEIEFFKDCIFAYDGREDRNGFLEPTKFEWKDYKKTFWLKKDKSE